MDKWKRVQELFVASADLPADEQSRFLNAACDDPELRGEVQGMLAADAEGPETLTRAVQDEAALWIEAPALPGERLGAYRVLSEIGGGGMGAVYLATRDDDQFHKRVAIKIVKLGMDTAEVLGRFRHERQILANLDHPYIARLLDGGTTATGRPYFVMDYVEGRPIDAFCAENALDVEARCRLFLRAMEAVGYAHRNLVVHRDLKPANIFVTAEGTPKLLDFGIAKLLTPDAASGFTAPMADRPLTPEYASPEQIRGLPVTTSSDIYSLGTILYELLTGHRAHAQGELLQPRQRNPKLAVELENIVLMAMRQEPERRYASVDQFAEDLKRYLDGWPVMAQPDSAMYRARKFAARHGYGLAAAALVVMSLSCGLVIALRQTRRAEAEAERARQRLVQMVDLSNLALSEAYAERISGATEDHEQFMKSSAELLGRLSREPGNPPALRSALATAYLRLGQLQSDLQSPNRGGLRQAVRSLNEGASLLEPLPSPSSPTGSAVILQWIDLRNLAGKAMLDLGNAVEGRKYLEQTLRVAENMAQAHPGDKATLRRQAVVRHWISGSYEAASDYPHAIEFTRGTLALLNALEQRFPEDADVNYDLSVTETRYGWELVTLGDPEAAAPHYERTIDLRERALKLSPDNMVYRRALKGAYEHMAGLMASPLMPNLGRPDDARKYFQKARVLEEAAFDDPQQHLAQTDYAHFLMMASIIDTPPGELEASLAGLRRAAAVYESFTALEPDLISTRRQLSTIHTYMGHRLSALSKYIDAIAEYRRGLAEAERIQSKLPQDDHAIGQEMEARRGLVQSLALAGDRAAAKEAQTKLLSRAHEAPSTDAVVRATYITGAQLARAAAERTFGDRNAACSAARAAIAQIQPYVPAAPRRSDPGAILLREAQAVLGECEVSGFNAAR